MKREPEWRITGYGNATNYGANKLRFVSPVPAGSKVHSRGRLIGVEAHPKGTQVTQEINVHVVGTTGGAHLRDGRPLPSADEARVTRAMVLPIGDAPNPRGVPSQRTS
jgi:acyl dehydratase